MEFQEVIRKRRSIRHFLDQDVTDELVYKLLDAARWAPTGGNLQPWEFILIRDPDRRKDLVDATFIGYMAKTGKPQAWILEASLIIAACANIKPAVARYGEMARENVLLDVAAAVENLLLAATNEGLAACWISGFNHEKVAEILNIPEGLRVLALLPIGYSDRQPGSPPRLDPEEFTFYETYGQTRD